MQKTAVSFSSRTRSAHRQYSRAFCTRHTFWAWTQGHALHMGAGTRCTRTRVRRGRDSRVARRFPPRGAGHESAAGSAPAAPGNYNSQRSRPPPPDARPRLGSARPAGRAVPPPLSPAPAPRERGSRRDSALEARGRERHGARDRGRPLPGRRGYVRGALRGAGSGSGSGEHGADERGPPLPAPGDRRGASADIACDIHGVPPLRAPSGAFWWAQVEGSCLYRSGSREAMHSDVVVCDPALSPGQRK